MNMGSSLPRMPYRGQQRDAGESPNLAYNNQSQKHITLRHSIRSSGSQMNKQSSGEMRTMSSKGIRSLNTVKTT